MLSQLDLFEIEREEAPHGYSTITGKPRQRPVKEVEYAIFDLPAWEVPEDNAEHLEWQKVMRERCEEIQAGWSDSEKKRRTVTMTDPLVLG